jgi:PAS domain S-box-containing protein
MILPGNIEKTSIIIIHMESSRRPQQDTEGGKKPKSGELFVRAFMNSPVAISICHLPDRAFVDVNAAFCRMVGYSREEALGRTAVELGLFQNPADQETFIAKFKASGFVREEEILYTKRGGIPFFGRTSYEYLESGGERYVLSMIEDVTGRRRLDREIRESDAHYRALFDSMSSAVVEEDFSSVKNFLDSLKAEGVSDFDAHFRAHPDEIVTCVDMVRVLRFNNEYVGYLNLPDKVSVLSNLRSYIPEETMVVFREELVALASGKTGFDITFPNLIPGSRVKHTRMRLKIVPGHEERWSSVLITFIDLTKEMEAQKELAELVQQKDMLMRELEHRVKNNLNIISSLLSLESVQIAGNAEKRILLDAQVRIKSIALIYELLSRSSQGSTLNCKSYVESLGSLLQGIYIADRSDIALSFAIDDCDIDMKRGVSLGLVVTELLTNSFKYAFPDRGGTVEVGLAAGEEWLDLAIGDDGIGLPGSADISSMSSLGFQLVNMLVQQMRGTLKSSSSAAGFRVEIRIPRRA